MNIMSIGISQQFDFEVQFLFSAKARDLTVHVITAFYMSVTLKRKLL